MSTPKKQTVAVGRNINQGRVLWLSPSQADARAANLELDAKANARGGKTDPRARYTVTSPVYFKPGEELLIEGKLDRGLEIMFGLNEDRPVASEDETDVESEKAEGNAPEADTAADAQSDVEQGDGQ